MAFDGIAPVIDADGHINDWHLEWQQRVPPELREFAPRSIIGDNGWRQLEIDGRRLPTGGTRRNQKTTTRPAKYWASNRPGEQRPEPRLPDMDEMGIDVAVLFGGHCFLVESVVESQKAAIATLRAYNDYLIDYCSADRKRLKGAAMVPIQSGADAAAELRRAVEGGLVAGVVPPHHANGMMLSSRSLYPLYEAAQDLGVPICVHTIGIQINPAQTLLGEDEILRPAYGNISSQMALGSLIVGGVLDAFPRLTVAFLEAGAGWVPHVMDRLQFNYEFFGSTTYRLKRTPEEYIKSGRVYFATDPDEATLPTVAAMIGEDHLVLGSDYCHPEGMSPYTMRILYERPDVSPTLKRKILSDSPGRLYRIAV